MTAKALLKVENLRTQFQTYEGIVQAVDGVDLIVNRESIYGLVGESGCGKSVTALSIMRLIQTPPGRIVGGQVLFNDRELLGLSEKEMCRVRGAEISMIFQEPMSSLNPIMRLGDQMAEVIRIHRRTGRKATDRIITDALIDVEIADPERVKRQFPFELSGGMRQRIMIATALALEPSLLIADEPTTALDVTIQAQVLELMVGLARKHRAAVLLITHDLGVVAEYCDKISVMYAGRIVETGEAAAIFNDSAHPYTAGLLKSALDVRRESEDLFIIPGSVPDLIAPPLGCRFHPRCDISVNRCSRERPPMFEIGRGHGAACWQMKSRGQE